MSTSRNYPSNLNYLDLTNKIETIGPRVYNITGVTNIEDLKIFIIGCQGSGNDFQKRVARLMDNAEVKPDLVLVLGDNLYDNGASSPHDPNFDECFYNIYCDTRLQTKLGGVPFFLLSGNHDENRHIQTRYLPTYTVTKGREVIANEVMHTYLAGYKANYYRNTMLTSVASTDSSKYCGELSTEDKIKLFSQETLDIDNLPKWNMPYYYYSLVIGNLQIFCLNSNTYAADFLNYYNSVVNPEKYKLDEPNQVAWFEKEYSRAISSGKKVILAQHHPFYTSGKRAFKFDWEDYLTREQLSQLQQILHVRIESYNELLRLILAAQYIKVPMLFAAHDHCLQYYNKIPNALDTLGLCQITSGGGGGDLQRRATFKGHDDVGCYLKNYGYVALSCNALNPEKIFFDFFTTEGHHLKFNNESYEPICNEISDENLKLIRATILGSVDEYFSLILSAHDFGNTEMHSLGLFKAAAGAVSTLLSMYNLKHDDIDEIHNITAYLNQFTLPSYNEAIKHLFELFSEKLSNPQHPTRAKTFANLLSKLAPYRSMFNTKMRQQFKEDTITEIAKLFEVKEIKDAGVKASALVDFGLSLQLNSNKHPFHVLIDINLTKKFKQKYENMTLEKFYHAVLSSEKKPTMRQR